MRCKINGKDRACRILSMVSRSFARSKLTGFRLHALYLSDYICLVSLVFAMLS